MPESSENQPDKPGGEMDLAVQSMNILGSLHAAIINFHLYPPSSELVQDSIKRALDDLREALSAWGSISFCELGQASDKRVLSRRKRPGASQYAGFPQGSGSLGSQEYQL